MPQDESSDPKIVNRLKNLPPFDEETLPDVAPTAPGETPIEPEPEVEAEGDSQTEVKEEEKPVEEEKDRTKEQFEKLKEHNAALKEQLEVTKRKNALESLYPEPQSPVTNVIPTAQQFPELSNKEIKDVFVGLVDANGYVDTGLLTETLKETSQRAKLAEERAQKAEDENKRNTRRIDDFERGQIMKEVHLKFPKLDPANVNSEDETVKFDDNFYDLFQGETIRQWTSTGQADAMKVAEKISGILYPVKKVDKQKMEEAELAKKNINATRVSSTSTHDTSGEKEDLVKRTQKGSHTALMERLNKIGQ